MCGVCEEEVVLITTGEGGLVLEADFWQKKGRILDVGAVGRCGLDGRGVGTSKNFFWNGMEALLCRLGITNFSFKW